MLLTLHQIFRKNLLPRQCSFSTSTSIIWFKNSFRSLFSDAESKLSNKNPPAFALLQTFPKAKGRTWTTLRNETTLIICVHICPPFWLAVRIYYKKGWGISLLRTLGSCVEISDIWTIRFRTFHFQDVSEKSKSKKKCTKKFWVLRGSRAEKL